jgi:hypothetical protein
MRLIHAFLAVVACMLVLCGPATVLAWGPSIHDALAAKFYQNADVLDLANKFGTNVSDVTGGAGDLDTAGSPDHGNYHSGQWDMVQYRQYAYASNWASNRWYDSGHGTATLIKYMLHNLGDVSVPIGHSPANQNPNAPSNTLTELILEGSADLGSYGSPVTPTSWYSGTISQVVGQFYTDCMANTHNFVDLGASNSTVANEGWRIDQMLGRCVMADYYLSQCSPADAGADRIVTQGGPAAVFDATALRDPDNITWNSDGSKHYRSDWTGITQVRWDFNNDGAYDYTGLTASKSYLALKALFHGGNSGTCRIDVLDDEGLHWTDTANISLVIPEPSTIAMLIGMGLAVMLRRLRRGMA